MPSANIWLVSSVRLYDSSNVTLDCVRHAAPPPPFRGPDIWPGISSNLKGTVFRHSAWRSLMFDWVGLRPRIHRDPPVLTAQLLTYTVDDVSLWSRNDQTRVHLWADYFTKFTTLLLEFSWAVFKLFSYIVKVNKLNQETYEWFLTQIVYYNIIISCIFIKLHGPSIPNIFNSDVPSGKLVGF